LLKHYRVFHQFFRPPPVIEFSVSRPASFRWPATLTMSESGLPLWKNWR
jgi:hypothetical protein